MSSFVEDLERRAFAIGYAIGSAISVIVMSVYFIYFYKEGI